jgi:hypothetical protein
MSSAQRNPQALGRSASTNFRIQRLWAINYPRVARVHGEGPSPLCCYHFMAENLCAASAAVARLLNAEMRK